jgi:hypothetical protein
MLKDILFVMYEKALFLSCAITMLLGASAFAAVMDGLRDDGGAEGCKEAPGYYRIGSSSYEVVIATDEDYEILLPLPQSISEVSAFTILNAAAAQGNIRELSVQGTEHGFALALKGSGDATVRFEGDGFEGMLTLCDDIGKNMIFCSAEGVRLALSYAHTTWTYMDDGGEYDRQWVSVDTYAYELQGPLYSGWAAYDIPYDMTED